MNAGIGVFIVFAIAIAVIGTVVSLAKKEAERAKNSSSAVGTAQKTTLDGGDGRYPFTQNNASYNPAPTRPQPKPVPKPAQKPGKKPLAFDDDHAHPEEGTASYKTERVYVEGETSEWSGQGCEEHYFTRTIKESAEDSGNSGNSELKLLIIADAILHRKGR